MYEYVGSIKHGGYHGSCERVRASLNTLVQNNPQLALQRGDRKREAGFQSALFCPVPIGDSPSSKRMYDVLNVCTMNIHLCMYIHMHVCIYICMYVFMYVFTVCMYV